MNKQDYLYLGCFLNKTASYYKCNPLKADPIRILKDHFEFDEPKGHIEAFNDFCRAALNDHFNWNNGSPGNAAYYGEKLELLIEAAYLIHDKSKKYQLKKRHATAISIQFMPMPLNAAEFNNPLIYFKRFFDYQPLSHWKKTLTALSSACISNFSAAEEVELSDLLESYNRIQKLFYAAWRLLELLEKE
ncbi:hypothetical protein ABDK00_018210 [Niabella insulamsoli]|uniref:hypothetical protein n=1 Tax=Niabella insulamsoli TaxID=3144874 RepID=UPI0031FC466F